MNNLSDELKLIINDQLHIYSQADQHAANIMMMNVIQHIGSNLNHTPLPGIARAMCCLALSMSYLMEDCGLKDTHIEEICTYYRQNSRIISQQSRH